MLLCQGGGGPGGREDGGSEVHGNRFIKRTKIPRSTTPSVFLLVIARTILLLYGKNK